MKKTMGVLVALGLVLGGAASAQKGDSKAAQPAQKEPFYRRYLIAGNPLDERIREQEKLVEADPTSAALHNDFGNLLAAQIGNQVSLFNVTNPSAPAFLLTDGPPGCVWFDLSKADGALSRGLWLPLGVYGVSVVPIPPVP